MSLKGTLKDFGIADILQLIGHQLKTGVLKLANKDQEVFITFVDGNVVKAESATRDQRDLLGSLLLRAEVLNDEQLSVALDIQRRTLKRLGDILVDSGYMPRETIREFTRLQTTETIYKLFVWKSGTYEFEQQAIDLDKENHEPIRSESVLMEGFRMVDEWPFIRKRITSYAMRFEVIKPLPAPVAKKKESSEEDFLSGIDDAFAATEEPKESKREKSTIGDNERHVFSLIKLERDVQKLIDLSRMGEFETCKALLNLLNNGVLVAIPPPRGVEASAPSEVGALVRPRLLPRLVPVLVRVGMSAVLLGLLVLLVEASGFDPGTLWRGNSMLVDGAPVEEALSARTAQRIEYALAVFHLEHGRYPLELQELVESGMLRPYELRAPWEQPFAYRSDGASYLLQRPFR